MERVLEIAGLEGFIKPFGLGYVCVAIVMLAVLGLLFLGRYIIKL